MLKQGIKEKVASTCTKLADVMIIIIDDCAYSRIACESMMAEIAGQSNIFSFECFTDYKLWSGDADLFSQDRFIMFNAASGLFYTNDVVNFLMQFNEASDPCYDKRMVDYMFHEKSNDTVSHIKAKANVMLLTSTRRPQQYRNAIITHYMVKKNPMSAIAVVCDFYEMSVDAVKKLLSRFLHGTSIDATYALRALNKSKRHFTANDIRAMNILLSGESIRAASSRYYLAEKTLYSQCVNVLDKLTF